MNKVEKITALSMLLITYFFLDNFLKVYSGGFAITIFTILILTVSIFYLKKYDISLQKNDKGYLIYTLLISISFSVFSNKTILSFQYLMLFISLAYWLIVVSKRRTNNKIDENIFMDLFNRTFILPMKNFGVLLKSLLYFENFKNNIFSSILFGLIIAFPLMIFVSALLVSTDITFSNFINKLISFEFLRHINVVLIVISFILASGLFAALYVNTHGQELKKNFFTDIKGNELVIKTILVSFIVLYVIYLISVLNTYLNYRIDIKSASDISGYARTGFFELSIVAFINFILFVVCKWLNSKEKILLSIIGIQTVGITILGILRMFIYINVYGLTALRFNTSVFMILMVIVVIIFIWGLFVEFNYVKISVLIVSMVFLLINYINIDRQIVNYNKAMNKFHMFSYMYNYEVIDEYIAVYKDGLSDFKDQETAENYLKSFNRSLNDRSLLNYNLELLQYKIKLSNLNLK